MPCDQLPKKRSSSAFTLIELLVVVAIIVILIAVLMPSLAVARKQASQVKCLSNMRQVGYAILLYTMENDGRIPSVSPHADVPGSTYWWYLMPPYLTNGRLSANYTAFYSISRKYFYCKELADYVSVREPSAYSTQTGLFALNALTGPGSWTSRYYKLPAVTNPAQKIGISEAGFVYGTMISDLNPSYMEIAAGVPYTGGIHGKSGNIWYLDGHAEPWIGMRRLTSGLYSPFGPNNSQNMWSP